MLDGPRDRSLHVRRPVRWLSAAATKQQMTFTPQLLETQWHVLRYFAGQQDDLPMSMLDYAVATFGLQKRGLLTGSFSDGWRLSDDGRKALAQKP